MLRGVGGSGAWSHLGSVATSRRRLTCARSFTSCRLPAKRSMDAGSITTRATARAVTRWAAVPSTSTVADALVTRLNDVGASALSNSTKAACVPPGCCPHEADGMGRMRMGGAAAPGVTGARVNTLQLPSSGNFTTTPAPGTAAKVMSRPAEHGRTHAAAATTRKRTRPTQRARRRDTPVVAMRRTPCYGSGRCGRPGGGRSGPVPVARRLQPTASPPPPRTTVQRGGVTSPHPPPPPTLCPTMPCAHACRTGCRGLQSRGQRHRGGGSGRGRMGRGSWHANARAAISAWPQTAPPPAAVVPPPAAPPGVAPPRARPWRGPRWLRPAR
jgi:hypothetical protein